MNYQQGQSGRYYTILYNTAKARDGIGELIGWLVQLNDFCYFNQIRERILREPFILTFSRNNIRRVGGKTLIDVQLLGDRKRSSEECEGVIDSSTLPTLIKDYFVGGYRTVEVGFMTANSVIARPLSRMERLLGMKDKKENSFSGLYIELGRYRIHVYTNDKNINSHVGGLEGVISHKGGN